MSKKTNTKKEPEVVVEVKEEAKIEEKKDL